MICKTYNPEIIGVAVGLVFNEKSQILIAQRQSHQALSACWEFPGGKINEDESVYCALKRELAEEINLRLRAAYPLINHVYTYPHGTVHLHFWHVTQFTGQAEGAEGQDIRWIDMNDLNQYPFPEGNQPVIQLMRRHRMSQPIVPKHIR